MVVFSLTEIVRNNLRNLDLEIVKWYGKFSLNSTVCVSESVVTSLSEDDFKIKIRYFIFTTIVSGISLFRNEFISGIDDFFEVIIRPSTR